MKGMQPTPMNASHPVLAGLKIAGIAGKDIADIVEVSASTLSKWRSGSANMPPETRVFLTLVLASVVEDMESLETQLGDERTTWNGAFSEQLHNLRRMLRDQEAFNATLAPEAVLAGASRFRRWLTHSGGFGGLIVHPSLNEPVVAAG